MLPDMWLLYRNMLKSRLFEEAVMQLWQEGRISGEMHLGLGEDAVFAGVLDHLIDNDAMALDHRGTPPLIMRGVDPVSLLREFLGMPNGLCKGMGGHMHLFSRSHLAASSGIVGSSGPAAVGFALAAQQLRPGSIALAFFGEGAMNQGMLMEAMNLASSWNLPVLFVCKDNEWSITTPSKSVTGGRLDERVRGLGLYAMQVNGLDVEAVWNTAKEAVERTRHGGGATLIHATCSHLEGHFLGDPLVQLARHPLSELKQMAGPLLKAFTRIRGTNLRERTDSLSAVTALIGKTVKESHSKTRDPLLLHRVKLEKEKNRLETLEEEVRTEMQQIVKCAMETD